jgi:hypothetical protein
MRHLSVLVASAFLSTACASSPAEPGQPVDPQTGQAEAVGCFTVHLGGEPSPDVSLPALIQLTTDPAPGFVTPGRLAVREPATSTPRAPISWWVPQGDSALELVLGGGYTGYSFSLTSQSNGSWAGQGTYWADMGLEPAPGPLPLRLIRRACP